MKIAIISDTHLTSRADGPARNLEAAYRWIDAEGCALAVHLGDVTADAPAHPEDLRTARALLARIPVPLHLVPGNHDVGEAKDSPRSHGEAAVTEATLSSFRAKLGPDRWSIIIEGWQLIGLNAQIMGDEEFGPEQRIWLKSVLAEGTGPVGLFLHKPLFRDRPDRSQHHQRYLSPRAAAELMQCWSGRDIRFVAAGHTHQWRSTTVAGVDHVWAPSLAYAIPDMLQEPIGTKMVGALLLEIDGKGHCIRPVVPAGVVQHMLSDLPTLYPELTDPQGRAAG